MASDSLNNHPNLLNATHKLCRIPAFNITTIRPNRGDGSVKFFQGDYDMKSMRSTLCTALTLVLMIGLVGCSRTIDDVARWKAKGNIEKLISALADPKVEVRTAATQALGELKAEPAVDAIAALFSDGVEAVRLEAVTALAAIGSESTITPMIAALKLDNPDARKVAAIALGQLKAPSAVEPLAEILSDPEEAVQCIAAASLGQIGEAGASPPLAAKLKSSSEPLRLACAQALGKTGGEAAVKGLIGAMADRQGSVREAAVQSLMEIGEPSVPLTLAALKEEDAKIRAGSMLVLKGLNATPTKGSDWIWLLLARVSTDNKDDIHGGTVQKLAKVGEEAVDTLLEAAAHNVSDIREHAFSALEIIGKSCTAKAMEAAASNGSPAGAAWFKARSSWSGAPAWRIDLWAALAALNPQFDSDPAKVSSLQAQARAAFNVVVAPDFKPTREYIPLLIDLLGDQTTPPPEQPDVDEFGMPVIKKRIDRFRGEANQQMAKEKLLAAGSQAAFPLIAALEDSNGLIAGNAASILGELGDKRALKPLMRVLGRKIEAGEQLSNSPFYNALQNMDDPSAESLLLKVRPNSDRAMRVFERQYAGVRPMSAENRDSHNDYDQPTVYRIGYIDNGGVGEMIIIFAKDELGDWKPAPPLPDQLPK